MVLIKTDDMLADSFTKHLARQRHEYLRRLNTGYMTSTDLDIYDSKPGVPKKLLELPSNSFGETDAGAYKH